MPHWIVCDFQLRSSGGGEDQIDEGMKTLLALRQRQVKEYVQRVRVAGFGERFENGRADAMLNAYVRAH